VLYTDFTEIVYGGGKAWLIAIIDHDVEQRPMIELRRQPVLRGVATEV
jgi:hypothetical protein